MLLQYVWIAVAFVAANFALTMTIILKLRKQEKFQTSEAHANLQLINQSLNRLSEIAEKFEGIKLPPVQFPDQPRSTTTSNRINQTKEQKALTLIRQGENPRQIGRKLGISKSEMDLLVASEKLSVSH
jgi:DNA-binding NarL/FixJ family response regulator